MILVSTELELHTCNVKAFTAHCSCPSVRILISRPQITGIGWRNKISTHNLWLSVWCYPHFQASLQHLGCMITYHKLWLQPIANRNKFRTRLRKSINFFPNLFLYSVSMHQISTSIRKSASQCFKTWYREHLVDSSWKCYWIFYKYLDLHHSNFTL